MATAGSLSGLAGCSVGPLASEDEEPCEIAESIVSSLLATDIDAALDYHPYPHRDATDEEAARQQLRALLITDILERNGGARECTCAEAIEGTDLDILDETIDGASIEAAYETRVDISFDDANMPEEHSVFVTVLETDEGQYGYPADLHSEYGLC